MLRPGDTTRAYYEVIQGVESPFPGLADISYLAAYPILIAGHGPLVTQPGRVNDRANVIDSMIFTVSVAVVMWVYLMEPYAQDPSDHRARDHDLDRLPADRPVAARDSRPADDGARGARPPAYYLLRVSLLGLRSSRTRAYTFTLLNETYLTGRWSMPAGWISYVVWGTAALHPSMNELSKPLRADA